jgi:hypothetical protein
MATEAATEATMATAMETTGVRMEAVIPATRPHKVMMVTTYRLKILATTATPAIRLQTWAPDRGAAHSLAPAHQRMFPLSLSAERLSPVSSAQPPFHQEELPP